jgi:hypothetical protein
MRSSTQEAICGCDVSDLPNLLWRLPPKAVATRSPARASISRNCFCVRMSTACATSYPHHRRNLWECLYTEHLVNLPSGVKKKRKAEFVPSINGCTFARLFIRDGQNYQPTMLEGLIESLRSGISLRHGGHQVAQKFTSTTLAPQVLQSPSRPL